MSLIGIQLEHIASAVLDVDCVQRSTSTSMCQLKTFDLVADEFLSDLVDLDLLPLGGGDIESALDNSEPRETSGGKFSFKRLPENK
jgi:hypothetical protein